MLQACMVYTVGKITAFKPQGPGFDSRQDLYTCMGFNSVKTNSAFHPNEVGKCVTASAGR